MSVRQFVLSDVALRHKEHKCLRSPKNNLGRFFFGWITPSGFEGTIRQFVLSDVALRHKEHKYLTPHYACLWGPQCLRSPKNNLGRFFFGVATPVGCLVITTVRRAHQKS